MKTLFTVALAGSSFLLALPTMADDPAAPADIGAPPPVVSAGEESARPLGAAIVSGIVVGSTGITAAAVGGILLATVPSWEGCPPLQANQTCDDFEPSNVTAQRTTGIALMVGGAALVGVAVPLLVVGASNRGSTAASGAREATAALSVGPGNAKLRFRF